MATEAHDFDSIAASSRFAFALKDGELWACGANERGQLGIDSAAESLKSFTRVNFEKRIRQVACGWEHTVLLTEDDSVYVAGGGSKGQLGLGEEKTTCQAFSYVEIGERVKQVCCGVWFTLALGESGKIFGWGSNRDCCLSQDPLCSVFWSPICLDFVSESKIVKVAAGHRHVVALQEDKSVHSWGSNRFQQVITHSGPVSDVFAGWHHSIIQISETELKIFGKNDHNQLAHVDPLAHENTIRVTDPIRSIATGSDHTLILLQSGQLLSFGWNEHGILGDGTNETRHGKICTVPFDKEIKNIFCGYGSCFLLTH